jgi:hypothetical protein
VVILLFFPYGARGEEVDEPEFGRGALAGTDITVTDDFEGFPEPKILTPDLLRDLIKRHHGFHAAAAVIGASEAFVRQRSAELAD